MSEHNMLEKGIALGPRKQTIGTLKIISEFSDIENITGGNIVYIPDSVSTKNNILLFYNLAKKEVGAILCEHLERTDHGVLLANELGIPCISEISPELENKEGEKIIIQDNKIFSSDSIVSSIDRPDEFTFPDCSTKIKINLGFPEVIRRQPSITKISDGIGFMRLEFILLDILNNTHPKEYLKNRNKKELETQLADRIEPIVDAYTDPVWIRTDDFAVSHLKEMEGGERYETQEENSALGWRGISRSIDDPFLYKIQIEAIKKLISRGYENIGLFPPMTRFQTEFQEWKNFAMKKGLRNVSFGLMIETPSAALTFERFTDDIDFLVFGSNDLTQFTLAIDRNNPKLQSKFDEKADAVLKLFDRVISIANKEDIETCIGGQAASDEQLAKKLISFGIDSLSVNPDQKTISQTRNFVNQAE